MPQLQNSSVRLRIVSSAVIGTPMGNVVSYLRSQADSIDETANRCTDPVIVSELQQISSELRAKAEKLEEIRELVPDHFLLVPGVGAQGGSLEEVAKYGMNDMCGLLVNSSRQIIYASDGEDFAEKARNEAINVQLEMEELLLEADLL